MLQEPLIYEVDLEMVYNEVFLLKIYAFTVELQGARLILAIGAL
jgi:hypothetical protein